MRLHLLLWHSLLRLELLLLRVHRLLNVTLGLLRNHILVKVVHRIGAIRACLVVLDLNFIQVFVDLWFERILDHHLSFGSGKFVCQPKQKLIFLPLSLLSELSESILQVIEIVIAKLEEEFNNCVSIGLWSPIHKSRYHTLRLL